VEKIDLYPDGEVKALLRFSFDGVDKAAGSLTTYYPHEFILSRRQA
jgi:hypothetical protein